VCLMMYLGSSVRLRIRKEPSISVVSLRSDQEVVRNYLRDEPHVYFIGSHTGCSCGFPSSIAESPVEYFEEMFDESNSDRMDNIASVHELLLVLDECLVDSDHCVLLPLWNGTESNAPKGDVNWKRDEMFPDTFVVTEQFRYTIHRSGKSLMGIQPSGLHQIR